MEQVESLMEDVAAEWIMKFLVPTTAREEILRSLFQMNIHPSSLFSGGDGLGRFCAQKAELWGFE